MITCCSSEVKKSEKKIKEVKKREATTDKLLMSQASIRVKGTKKGLEVYDGNAKMDGRNIVVPQGSEVKVRFKSGRWRMGKRKMKDDYVWTRAFGKIMFRLKKKKYYISADPKMVEKREVKKKAVKMVKINTINDFEKIIPLDAHVLLVGNGNYERAPLQGSHNDSLLISRIMNKCLKVPKENIHILLDAKADDFRKKIKEITLKMDSDDVFIMFYSGHGDTDGSFIFLDNKKVSPLELKKLINSFPNDTVMFIDACYSGNNEGAKEVEEGVDRLEFKENSIRIYASLAHQTAREIEYEDDFFKKRLDFYEKTLNLKKLNSNGYFTAMVGLFFAEYELKPDENVSYTDLLSFVNNKGNEYLEYLFQMGQTGSKLAMKSYSKKRNQSPKILPIKRKPRFEDPDNRFIVLQQSVKKIGLQLNAGAGYFVPVGQFKEAVDGGLDIKLSLNYELRFITYNLFLDMGLELITLNSKWSSDLNTRKSTLQLIPLTAGLSFRLPVTTETLYSYFMFMGGGGIAYVDFRQDSFKNISSEQKDYFVPHSYVGAGYGISIMELIRMNLLVIEQNYHFKDNMLFGLGLIAGLSLYI